MMTKFNSVYQYARVVRNACKRIIAYIEQGEYRRAIVWLENLSKQATKVQVEESIEDPNIEFGDLKEND